MLVDDHAVVRMGFKMLLETDLEIKVVAEADSGEQAIQRFVEFKPCLLYTSLWVLKNWNVNLRKL